MLSNKWLRIQTMPQAYAIVLFSHRSCSARVDSSIVLVPTNSRRASYIFPMLLNLSLRTELELTIDWSVLLNDKKPFTSSTKLRTENNTHNAVVWVSTVTGLDMGPDPKTMSDATGSTRALSPRGRMTLQKMLRYQARFLSVIPKRMKNVTANITLIQWSTSIPKTVQNPDDCHSSEVAVGMVEKDACATFHPGQKPRILPPKIFTTSWRIAKGNVRSMSNKPRARSLKNALPFIVVWLVLLSRVASKSWLRLKYVMINLAVGNVSSVWRSIPGKHSRAYNVSEVSGNNNCIESSNKNVKPNGPVALAQPYSSMIWNLFDCTM